MNETRFVPVVGVGASAGGVEALKALFTRLPGDTGAAYVVAIHMLPDSESMLPALINKVSAMPTLRAAHGQTLKANTISVVPPGHDVSLYGGRLHLSRRDKGTEDGPRLLDGLFKGLAAEYGANAVVIVLSGTGTDGVNGARAVMAEGGFVLVESAETARHPGLPQAVFETGAANDQLPLPTLAERLAGYLARFAPSEDDEQTAYLNEAEVGKILAVVRAETGHDFSSYKLRTLRRQLTRQLAVQGIESVDAYRDYLARNPEEARKLVKYLLIRVTRFFRDPEAFEALKEKAIRPLLEQLNPSETPRVWVAGCSTGQEAYSIAILIDETMRELGHDTRMTFQLFASDANPDLIAVGRGRTYPHAIANEVSAERLERYFNRTEEGYKVSKRLANHIVWAGHNLLSDPPFSKLHLVSFRNVLIYLRPNVQEKMLALVAYALKVGGYLFLGTAETVRDTSDGLQAVDHAHRIYQKSATKTNSWLKLEFPLVPTTNQPAPGGKGEEPGESTSRERTFIEQALLAHYGLTALIVDEYNQVTYTYGQVDHYLRMTPGRVKFTLFEMLREGLQADLTTALYGARNEAKTVAREGVWMRTNGNEQIVNITVLPVNEPAMGSDLMLVIFEPVTALPDGLAEEGQEPGDEREDTTITRLRRELSETESALRSATQALQAKNEELSSSLEEIRSASEEAQTTNEELVTSKEELESMNTELNTLNEQLVARNDDLQDINNDLHNLLGAIQLSVIFLDLDLNIRTFTPAASDLFNIIDSDKGRPLSDLVTQLDHDAIIEDATTVLDTLNTVSKEVQTKGGRWYQMRIMPYRTVSNVIDGLVLTFNDISDQITYQRRLEALNAEVEATRVYTQSIIDTVWAALLILDADLRVISANRGFYDAFNLSPDAIEGVKLYDLEGEQWQSEDLRWLLEDIIPQETTIRDYALRVRGSDGHARDLTLNARQLRYQNDERILLAMRFDEESP